MTTTNLNIAYSLGAQQAREEFTKESSNFLNLVSKYPQLARAAEFTAANPLASRAVGGGLMGGLAGGEDNRILGALAGAGLGAGSRFWAGRGAQSLSNRLVPRNMGSEQLAELAALRAGQATRQVPTIQGQIGSGILGEGTSLAKQLAGATVAGGAGLAGGLGMNALGLTDRPESWLERTFG